MYPTAFAPRSSIWKGTFGTASRSCSRRCHGHSCRNRSETSNVAPPHISSEYADASASAVAGADAKRSRVRMRVASALWCASRHVVSMSSKPSCPRTALANPAGPSSSSTCFNPRGGWASSGRGGTGSSTVGAGPTAPGCLAPFTATSPR